MPKISDPIKIGKMEVKNRVVAAPTYCGYADEEGYVTQRLIDLYEERAKGGAGLVTVEVARIRPEDRMFHRMLGAHSDRHIPGLSELAYVIHLAGAKASLQIQHSGRQSNPQVTGVQPVAPSARAPFGGVTPRVLTTEECEELLEQFALAAGRVKAAGFDAVMYHGTHGFLIQQFMSSYTNDRQDKYGDRLAFVTELIKKTRAVVGEDFPLIMRMSGDEFLGDKGITLEMCTREIVPALLKVGIDCIDVSAGVLETAENVCQPLYFPRGFLVHLAEGIREVSNVPVVAVGRINDPKLAERIIEDQRADMVALSRGLLADPAFPKKMLQGRYKEVRKCIACNACMDRTFLQYPVRCAVNPDFGREKDYQIRPALKSKQVLVIGGGVGGMEAARVAALRCHAVTLYERDSKLGGLVNLASSLPRLYTRELNNIVEWLADQIKGLPIKVELGREVTVRLVEELKPEAVILATGSLLEVPDIPRRDKGLVTTLDDYLRGEIEVGQKVAVIGGAHGAEVSISLAREGKEVTLLESGGPETIGAAPYLDMVRKIVLFRYLQEEKVRVVTEVRIKEITEKGVNFTDKEGKEENLEVATVILAPGRRPNNELAKELKGKIQELFEIGDSVQPRRILSAVHEGAFVAREL